MLVPRIALLYKNNPSLKKMTKLACSCFGKEQSKRQLTKGSSALSLSDLLDEENEGILESAMPSDPRSLLSSDLLQRCSPLMKMMLQDAQVRHPQSLSTAASQPKEQPCSSEKVHDLVNFRHMLAGSLPTEAALDKFCLKKKAPIILDIKYDGQRTLISYEKGGEVDMISRNGKSQKISYEVLRKRIQLQLEHTGINSIKMDGEIVVRDKETKEPLPLSELMKLKNIKNREIEDWELEMEGKEFVVYMFDVVEYNGENLMEKPLVDRRAFIPDIDIVEPVEYRVVHFPEERGKIFEFFREVLQRKYEGLIIKGQNDKYYTNETRTQWKKLKRGFVNTRDPNVGKVELDLIVMGANRGSGFNNQKRLNSFLMGTRHNGKIVPLSNVGSGFNQDLLEQIEAEIKARHLQTEKIPEEYDLQGIKADIFCKPELVFEVHAQEFTLSPIYNLGRGEYGGLSLRFPSFKRIRDDKGVNEATTGEQILEISKAYHLNVPK